MLSALSLESSELILELTELYEVPGGNLVDGFTAGASPCARLRMRRAREPRSRPSASLRYPGLDLTISAAVQRLVGPASCDGLFVRSAPKPISSVHNYS